MHTALQKHTQNIQYTDMKRKYFYLQFGSILKKLLQTRVFLLLKVRNQIVSESLSVCESIPTLPQSE